ncbi:MAG: hypothetical protein SH807_04665 [Blastochloris sp.]|nr:hypothetical protein [Blastochloris sp.]
MKNTHQNIARAKEIANILAGVGLLLTIIPLGLCIVSLFLLEGVSPLKALYSLGWAFMAALAMLPLGLGVFVGALAWMSLLKRTKQKAEYAGEYDDDDDV